MKSRKLAVEQMQDRILMAADLGMAYEVADLSDPGYIGFDWGDEVAVDESHIGFGDPGYAGFGDPGYLGFSDPGYLGFSDPGYVGYDSSAVDEAFADYDPFASNTTLDFDSLYFSNITLD